ATLEAPQKANVFQVREYLPMGQRIKAFTLEVKTNGEWKTVKESTTIGNKRLVRFETTEVEAVRFTIHDAKAAPVLSEMGLYLAPNI
ncbi:MAG: hypothetical protein ACPGCK_05775, partial [Flavobacteriaceae bacterium]